MRRVERFLIAGFLVLCAPGLLVLCACRAKEKAPDISALVVDLRNPDPEVSGRANLALISLGEPAVPPLIEMLKDEEPRLRLTAATTLWGMGPKAKGAVPALVAALSDGDTSVRVAAAMAFENMGSSAREAVPALVKALRDREGRVRQWAAKALGSIGPDAAEAIPALVEASKFDPIRPACEEAIRQIQGR